MQPLLLLHGAIGAKDQLEPLADQLRESYHVYMLNFSGHGGEGFPGEDFSIPLFTNEVLAFLLDNKISRVNIFGYSMGGYVAFCLASQYPHLVRKIITLATKFYWDETVAAKEVKMLDPAIITHKVPLFAEQLRERHSPNDWKLVLEKTTSMLLGLGRQNPLQLEDYKVIQTPSLLLLGEKDKMITIEETIAVQQALPHGEFRSLPGTPHTIEQVDMGLLANLTRGFIK